MCAPEGAGYVNFPERHGSGKNAGSNGRRVSGKIRLPRLASYFAACGTTVQQASPPSLRVSVQFATTTVSACPYSMGGLRAAMATATWLAPAPFSARAAVLQVAPVVMISSTNNTRASSKT